MRARVKTQLCACHSLDVTSCMSLRTTVDRPSELTFPIPCHSLDVTSCMSVRTAMDGPSELTFPTPVTALTSRPVCLLEPRWMDPLNSHPSPTPATGLTSRPARPSTSNTVRFRQVGASRRAELSKAHTDASGRYADSAKICNKSVKGTRCAPYFLRVLLKMAVFKSFTHTITF